MNKLGLALLIALLGFAPAQAQNVVGPAPVASAGAYNSSPPTCTSGQFCYMQVDSAGRQIVSIAPSVLGGVTPVSTAALAANLVVKAAAGNLYSFEVSADSTLSAAAWWIMIYNSATAPADGAVTPAKCYAMPLGATGATFGFAVPIAFSTGITIGVSTTGCFTKTASTHAFISGDAQ